MTLKKVNKKLEGKNGQAIFEYFILTAVIVTVVLFFMNSKLFQGAKTSCGDAFNSAVEEILK